jgi:DNA-binding NarL/FixJ family response regulator
MRIIVADHYPKARKALAALLNEQPGIDLIGEVAESNALLELARRQPVDVIMLDYGLPGIPLVELIDKIQTLNQPPTVIVMSSNPENARLALNAGADVFISKGDQPDWLLEVLHRYEKRIEEDPGG